MGAITQETVFHSFDFYTGFRNGVFDGVRGHGYRWSNVEPAASGLGQACTGVGNDDGFSHLGVSL